MRLVSSNPSRGVSPFPDSRSISVLTELAAAGERGGGTPAPKARGMIGSATSSSAGSRWE
jgi:hypothetical protein